MGFSKGDKFAPWIFQNETMDLSQCWGLCPQTPWDFALCSLKRQRHARLPRGLCKPAEFRLSECAPARPEVHLDQAMRKVVS